MQASSIKQDEYCVKDVLLIKSVTWKDKQINETVELSSSV
jgi:hypothetical protein